jgi:hypothetical protein
VVFRWAAGDDALANRPDAQVGLVHNTMLDSPLGGALGLVAFAGAAAMAVGTWGIVARRRRPEPVPDDDEGMAEALLRLAERSEAWLSRTRRYLLLAGVLGVVLWYPFLVPLVWSAGRDLVPAPWGSWLLAGLAALLLATLTFLWARALHQLDRDLDAWRAKVARLRLRERELLAELEG